MNRTNRELAAARTKAVAYLRQRQARNGAFTGQASPNVETFTPHRRQPTGFTTALILGCLHDQEEVADIQQKAAAFLLGQKSSGWSWNYWLRGSSMARQQPYPDDLDDTACALAALSQYDRRLIDGTALGAFAQQLVSTETSVGGPYNTWLVDTAAAPDWRDIDVAVNANVGFCLSLHGVTVPGLLGYLTEVITAGALRSTYYVGRLPVLYFLSRWYRGEALEALRGCIAAELDQKADTRDPLSLALLLSSACRLSFAPQRLQTVAARLLVTQQGGHWPAAALYYDPPIDGVLQYAGSASLTTAFVIEALGLYEACLRLPTPPQAKRIPRRPVVTQAWAASRDIPYPELRRNYRAALRTVVRRDTDRQISGMATLTAQACARRVGISTLEQLNSASLHGWIAYSIYDDILDDEAKPELLGVARFAEHTMLRRFRAALPEHDGFQTFVAAVLDVMDEASTWEARHARAPVRRGSISLKRLPDYGSLAPLWQRSWGHMLAASGTLAALGYDLDGPEQQALQRFFQHFLTARQLNDDAHDWKADLRRGHLTSAVTMLLKDYGTPAKLALTRLPELRLLFWQKTIIDLCTQISDELAAARTALEQCWALKDPSRYLHWLETIKAATEQALHERLETQKFMAAYHPEAVL